MEWNDQAILLHVQKYGERHAIASILTENHGKHKGMVFNITSKQNRATYQTGNLLNVTWRARLAEQLGHFKSDVVKPYSSHCLYDPTKLLALCALSGLLDCLLAEHEPHQSLYHNTADLIESIYQTPHWISDYIWYEIQLLSELGFHLELDQCTVTGTKNDLYYVSPKSGCAVCKDAGRPYHDKLLRYPSIIHSNKYPHDQKEIKNALALTTYFFNKYFFEEHSIEMPTMRTRFIEHMTKLTNITA